ncbi:hypothetical protein Nepgr_027096 [Nepenthes gracilis]|uniref:Uncharacterized protein n=1 Tax=Nepenthes gracilis TaxID=150966 RepID=A0AAD3T9R9_NEPGR|nr:hypothetical protein Nepgr_027096 [Nepenthes gracilis]
MLPLRFLGWQGVGRIWRLLYLKGANLADIPFEIVEYPWRIVGWSFYGDDGPKRVGPILLKGFSGPRCAARAGQRPGWPLCVCVGRPHERRPSLASIWAMGLSESGPFSKGLVWAQHVGSRRSTSELTISLLAAFVENEERAVDDQLMGCGPEWNRPITVAKPLKAQQPGQR